MTEEKMPCVICGIAIPMPHEDSDTDAQICDKCYNGMHED